MEATAETKHRRGSFYAYMIFYLFLPIHFWRIQIFYSYRQHFDDETYKKHADENGLSNPCFFSFAAQSRVTPRVLIPFIGTADV